MRISIEEVQTLIQRALTTLGSDPHSSSGLEYLVPTGYRPEVVLKEGGRKKRRNASFDHWSPDSGEISISFTRDQHIGSASTLLTPSKGTAVSNSAQPVITEGAKQIPPTAPKKVPPEQELCDVLGEVERQGRAFIALKWFRDDVLPSKGLAWATRPDERQAILARAIEKGLVVTSKIANPRTPAYPTTTIRLSRNHSDAAQGISRRYVATQIRGESLSETILRDRGSR